MTPEDFGIQIATESFLREIHHLLWIDPFINKKKRDAGWSCRDHALILAGVGQLRGLESNLVSGAAQFIQGPTTGHPPFGLFVDPHTWVNFDGLGTFDISITFAQTPKFSKSADWEPFRVIGSKIDPRGQLGYILTRDASRFESFGNMASHEENKRVAIYLEAKREPFDPKTLLDAFGWCNSPLTIRIQKIIKKNTALYPKAIMHLSDFLDGRAESLTRLPQMSAWKKIASERDESAQQVLDAMKAASYPETTR